MDRIECNRKEVIGKGPFGTYVFAGKFQTRKVAVKRLEKCGFQNIALDIATYISPSEPKHLNIVQYFAIEEDQDFWSVKFKVFINKFHQV